MAFHELFLTMLLVQFWFSLLYVFLLFKLGLLGELELTDLTLTLLMLTLVHSKVSKIFAYANIELF